MELCRDDDVGIEIRVWVIIAMKTCIKSLWGDLITITIEIKISRRDIFIINSSNYRLKSLAFEKEKNIYKSREQKVRKEKTKEEGLKIKR